MDVIDRYFGTRNISSSYHCIAPTTKRLEETSMAPEYHLTERIDADVGPYSRLSSVFTEPWEYT